MKKFIIKTSIIFIFSLLFFRFTVISLINEYENKLIKLSSSENIIELKKDILANLEKNNNKEKIFYPEDAKIISLFIKKIRSELDIN